MMTSEVHTQRARTGELSSTEGVQQEESTRPRHHKNTRSTGSGSPREVSVDYLDNDTKNMCHISSEALSVNGPCPKANESAALMVLRDHLRLNMLGMEQLILFDLWSLDRATIETALKKLSDLCNNNKNDDAGNNRAAFQLVNGLGIILEVMRKWHHDRKIQSLCCLVILNTLDGVDPKYLARLEIVDSVLFAMKTHAKFFPVQLCGCGALTGLCRNKTNVDHLVRNRQGIETIMCAMQRYSTTKKLHLWASLCLENILKWEDYRKVLLDVWVRVTIDDALFKTERTKAKGLLFSVAGPAS